MGLIGTAAHGGICRRSSMLKIHRHETLCETTAYPTRQLQEPIRSPCRSCLNDNVRTEVQRDTNTARLHQVMERLLRENGSTNRDRTLDLVLKTFLE